MSFHAMRLVPKFLVFWSAFAGLAGAREKIDVVVMQNGDRLTGEIKELERGRLKLDTDYMGTVEIEWEQVARLTSPQDFEIEDQIGGTYFGSLAGSPEADIAANLVLYPNLITAGRYLTPSSPVDWTLSDSIRKS